MVPREGPLLPDPERYEAGGILGRGGMGEVRVVYDDQLRREVALKTTREGDNDAAERLPREARLTASLAHPNIVHVFDAGRLPDGRPFYTMQLLPGRTLGDAVREAKDTPARLRLVRHVLAAAQAAAFAHRRGVLHRDLKPANVMVGPLGETVVGDWGLACARDAAAPARGSGTPGYTAPEQLAHSGTIPDERADVYSLGAILWEVLVGRAPPHAPVPALTAAAPDAPVDLAAIADRALRVDPAGRYIDAGAFADDLLAWFEGRRVAAHDYSALELLARLWNAWRAPLSVGGVALLILALTVAGAWTNTARERDRSLTAEADAVAAREASQRNLALALAAQALTAAGDDRRLEAETLAAGALALAPLPSARGVLARFGGRPRFHLASRIALPDCEDRGLAADGAWLVCRGERSLRVYGVAAPGSPPVTLDVVAEEVGMAGRTVVYTDPDRQVWRWTPPAPPVAYVGARARARRVWTSTVPGLATILHRGGSTLVLGANGQSSRRQLCPGAADQASLPLPDGSTLSGCDDGRVLILDPAGDLRELVRLPPEAGAVSALGPDVADGDRVGIGTVRGSIAVVDVRGRQVRSTVQLGRQAVTDVSVHGDRVAAAFADSSLVVYDQGAGLALGRIPGRGDVRVAWSPDGRRLAVAAAALEVWDVPEPTRPHLYEFPAGVSAVSISPDGERAAVALGDGTIPVLRLVDGARVATLSWQGGVVKDVAFSPDGRHLAAVAAGVAEQPVYETDSWRPVHSFPGTSGRRVAWLGGGLWFLDYRGLLRAWTPGAPDAPDRPFDAWELESDPDGRRAVALGNDDSLWRLGGGAPERIVPLPGASCAVPLGEDTLAGVPGALVRLGPRGEVLDRRPIPANLVDLAVTPDLQLAALGYIDGRVGLWRVGAEGPAAILVGHEARVSALAFSPDGHWLLTGGWDEVVRLWSVAELERDPTEIVRALEADWGRNLEAVLAGP